jgi:hypothetical protein
LLEILNDGFDLIERSQCQALSNRDFGEISRIGCFERASLTERILGVVVLSSVESGYGELA